MRPEESSRGSSEGSGSVFASLPRRFSPQSCDGELVAIPPQTYLPAQGGAPQKSTKDELDYQDQGSTNRHSQGAHEQIPESSSGAI